MAKPKPKPPLQSPELRAYFACVEAHVASPHGDLVPSDPSYDEAMAAGDRLIEARRAARLVIQNRPVRTWRDFVELAEVVRAELWDQLPDGSWSSHSHNEELETAMQAAVWKLIDGRLQT
jgi:uncharacterized hydantoinase/oxoprolinase family protein